MKRLDGTTITHGEIAKAVLMVVGLTGLVATGLVFPGIFQAVAAFTKKDYPRRAVRQAFHRLDKKGHLLLKQTRGGWRVDLSAEGRAEFLAYQISERRIRPSKKWDGTWHVLSFDVPEKRKMVRVQVRRFLHGLGFIRLQDSVWIFPYPCEEVLELLRTKFHIRHEALYLTVHAFPADTWLRKEFRLPPDHPKRQRGLRAQIKKMIK